MSRVQLEVQDLAVVGLAAEVVAPNGAGTGNGNTFSNDGQTFLLAYYTGAGTPTLTVPNVQNNTVNGVLQPALTFALAAGNVTPQFEMLWIPPNIYNDVDNLTAVDVSATANLKLAAIRMPRTFN